MSSQLKITEAWQLSMFENDGEVEEYTCVLCSEVCNRITHTKCNNEELYCLHCVRDAWKETNSCPSCENKKCRLIELQKLPDKLSNANIKCYYSGCKWKGKFGELENHLLNECTKYRENYPQSNNDIPKSPKNVPKSPKNIPKSPKNIPKSPKTIKNNSNKPKSPQLQSSNLQSPTPQSPILQSPTLQSPTTSIPLNDNEIQELQNEISSLKQRLSEIEKENEETTSRLKDEIESLKKANEEKTNKIKKLQENFEKLKKQLPNDLDLNFIGNVINNSNTRMTVEKAEEQKTIYEESETKDKEIPKTSNEPKKLQISQPRIPKKIEEKKVDLTSDRIKGLLYGAAIGDIKCNGLENLGLAEGQATQVTEMNLALMYGINEMVKANKSKFDVTFIAKAYDEWNKSSHPFTLGGTTLQCISQAPNVTKMKLTAKRINDTSQYGGTKSNGSLMRIMPLIIYCYRLKDDDYIFNIFKEESELSHYNYSVYYCNTAYAIACKYLINNFSDNIRHLTAIQKVEEFLNTRILMTEQTKENNNAKEVLNWVTRAKTNNISNIESTTKGPYIPVAFQRAFYHLFNKTPFQDALNITFNESGDRAANCCIVGGLLGCYWGYDLLPNTKNAVKNCQARRNRGVYQPNKYETNGYIKLMSEQSPTGEIVINEIKIENLININNNNNNNRINNKMSNNVFSFNTPGNIENNSQNINNMISNMIGIGNNNFHSSINNNNNNIFQQMHGSNSNNMNNNMNLTSLFQQQLFNSNNLNNMNNRNMNNMNSVFTQNGNPNNMFAQHVLSNLTNPGSFPNPQQQQQRSNNNNSNSSHKFGSSGLPFEYDSH